MADSQKFKSVTLYDSVSTFENGMDSLTNPLLLDRKTLAFANNCTVRGGFVTDRPPYSKSHLTYVWPSDEVQTAVEEGLFQGSAYYQPDSGDQSLIASISGRLFQFTIAANIVTVREITIPGDPNPASGTQAWIWQAENYIIVNDGISLPIFFDGVSSRRSAGPSVLLATVTAASTAAPPPIGSQVTLTLAAPYTGPFNVPVLFNGEYYQPIENPNGYLANLTSLFSNPGEAIEVNDIVYTSPVVVGVTTGMALPGGNFTPFTTLNIPLTAPYTGPTAASSPVAIFITLFGKVWDIRSATGNSIEVRANENGTYPASLAPGEKIFFSSSSNPNVVIGRVNVASAAPPIGATVQLTLDTAYTGPADQIVYLGTGQYTIEAVPPVPPGTSLTVINLSDTSTTNYAFPADAPLLSVPELPPGRMAAYGLGQNWVALVDGLSFIASDVSRGPSGTPANDFRDAVLKTVDLSFRGGKFSIPGAGNVITSMTFTANLDLALGQGSLEVGTASFMASCLAPFDFTNPPPSGTALLTYSLIGPGPLGQDSTINVNSDIYFRSPIGLGSFVLGRRNFTDPGNTPISSEMTRVIALDDQTLLTYGTAIVFDNRYLSGVSPQSTSQGVVHAGLIAMNLDTLSSLRGKQPAVYDGLWTGINILQIRKGIFNGKERAFAFTFNITLSKIELYEILPTGTQHFDNDTTAITWEFETASLFNEDVKPRDVPISLRDGEFAVEDVIGQVTFTVYFKADAGCWTPWHQFTICADKLGEPQYFPRLGLGEPSSALCDPILNTTLRDGYTIQVKFVITGHARLVRARFAAVTIPTPKFAPPICNLQPA